MASWPRGAEDGCFNADPHPGNILLLEDGQTLGLIDFGQVMYLPQAAWQLFRTFRTQFWAPISRCPGSPSERGTVVPSRGFSLETGQIDRGTGRSEARRGGTIREPNGRD